MSTIEATILADLKNDKRQYQAMMDRLPCDEAGCTIDAELLHHYMLTLDQIEADIARYSPAI